MTESESMVESMERMPDQDDTEAVNNELRAMSEHLDRLTISLARQQGECATKIEKKRLNDLQKDVKEQAAAISRLRDSIRSVTAMAMTSQALSEREDGKDFTPLPSADDPNDILFQAVTCPFRAKTRLLVHRGWQLEMKKMRTIRWRLRARATNAPPDNRGIAPHVCTSSVVESTSTASKDNDITTSSEEIRPTTPQDTFKIVAAAPDTPSSTSSSPKIVIQDWGILTPPEGLTTPPPLPRKSSRRVAYTPRVPTRKTIPPVPPVPTSPPPAVPESVSTRSSIDDLSRRASSSTTSSVRSAQSILSNLEKRYTKTLMTPPISPTTEGEPHS